MGLLLLLGVTELRGQLISADPAFPVQSKPVVITFDASLGNKGLMGYTGDVYAHTGVITSESADGTDWKHAPGWGDNAPKYKLTRIADDLYQLEIGPSINEYYGINPGEVVEELAFVFRSEDTNLQGKTESNGDIFHPVYVEGLNVSIIHPDQSPLIVEMGDSIFLEVQSQQSDSLFLYHEGELLEKSNEEVIIDTFIVDQEGKHWIWAEAKDATETVTDSFYYFTRTEVPVADLPEGVEDGINYVDDQTATLVLYAPGKEYVHVIGSFTDWELDNEYFMNVTPDGKRFWLTIENLEAGKEYLFQYLVDGSILIGDPYAEKVSDSNDRYIGESTYPGLLPYPQDKTTGIASYLQTAQEEYTWAITDFTPPSTDELIVYELLIRDFIEKHDYKTLIDTIPYFKRLGVNAIELMPVNEFEGNSSWGYNVSHYFALDKYYGPKEDLQRFVDSCHAHGIAVILDIVLNHNFGQSPIVRLYWDAEANRPAEDSPWFNQVPKHEFNVGYDINHESEATKYLMRRVLRYWLEEYNVDGYRFDLSKGLTQKNTLGDAGAMARYDASRIAILKAYADTMWSINPDAYAIMEHFADNDEEQELTDYGMMVWGNAQYNYGRAGMGWNYDGKSDFSWSSYKTRQFSEPHLMSYMESHDEQRHMYDIVAWGNYKNPLYNVKENLELSLVRGELTAAFFFTLPGPKMLWQFGEMGYDYPLAYNGDKLGPKPIRWDFLEDPNRQRMFQVWSALAHLKTEYEVFNTRDFDIDVADTLKTIHLRHESMDVTVIGNFDTYPQTIDPAFTQTGTWYDYFSGEALEVTDVHMPIELDKSEYRIYTTVQLETPDLIAAPRALDVGVTGNIGVGEELTGHYTYFDANGDPEGESKYKWYRGEYADGTNKMQILGATEQTFTVRESDMNLYIFFEVTPVAASGDLLSGIKEYGTLDLAVSVEGPRESGFDLEVYPNPSSDGFHILMRNGDLRGSSLDVYDARGSLVHSLQGSLSGEEYYFDASGLEKGIYFLKIRQNGEVIVKRMVKM